MLIQSSECAPPGNAQVVCRQSWLVSLVAALIYIGLLGGVPATLWFSGNLPNIFALGLAAIATIVFPMLGDHVYAALLRSNWILAIGNDGIWLNLRSYRNYSFERADTVVRLTYDELGWAYQDIVRRSEDTGEGTATWREVSLCLQIQVSDINRLTKAIADERKRKATRTLLGGLITVTGRSNHAPIRVSKRGLVRLMWKSRYDFIRPKLRDVLHELSKHMLVHERRPDGTEKSSRLLTDQQLDERITALVTTGETLAAVKLLKLRRGYSIRQAKEHIDDLTVAIATSEANESS